MTALAVVLTVMVCAADARGVLHDGDDMEIRARTCEEALRWSAGWIPPGRVVASFSCREAQR